jgi:hypothetical protein
MPYQVLLQSLYKSITIIHEQPTWIYPTPSNASRTPHVKHTLQEYSKQPVTLISA